MVLNRPQVSRATFGSSLLPAAKQREGDLSSGPIIALPCPGAARGQGLFSQHLSPYPGRPGEHSAGHSESDDFLISTWGS